MGAQIVNQTCTLCLGHGRVDRLDERTPDGWVPNDQLPSDLADAWIARDGDRAPVRWTEVDCPRCGGIGSYEIELTPCRIF